MSSWRFLRRSAALELLATHRSIRKFKPRALPDGLLERTLETAMRSSNNGNMQTYSVIVTTDQQALDRLALIHDNGNVSRAPVLLTFVVDWTKMVRWCELRGGMPEYNNFNAFWTGANDAMVTAQSVALAAEAHGLGICFLGSTIWETRRLNAFFDLPQGVHVVTSLMMGYPDEAPSLRARLPAKGHIHYERYQPATDEAVLKHYASREHEGWNRYIKLYGPSWQQKLETHRLENLAQVYTCLKYSGQDFRLWSRRQLDSLEGQGFMDNAAREEDVACAVCKKMSHCLDPDRFKYASVGNHHETASRRAVG